SAIEWHANVGKRVRPSLIRPVKGGSPASVTETDPNPVQIALIYQQAGCDNGCGAGGGLSSRVDMDHHRSIRSIHHQGVS
ncbi:MAG: hypothetical protein QNJ22_22015, partial [Desulfosarcinaceae bacterium]|nr:hypothetical protein [Desulfosarcinaceae bacterium]